MATLVPPLFDPEKGAFMTIVRLLAAISTGLLIVLDFLQMQKKPSLTVYTYASFVSDWGPGPLIEPAFEAALPV